MGWGRSSRSTRATGGGRMSCATRRSSSTARSAGFAHAVSATKRFAGSSKRRWPASEEHAVAESAIAVRNLHKRYGAFEALRGVTLDVPAGSICGFLGRNGAGKTTTMKILLGIAHATSGEARVLGLDDDVEIRKRTGFVSEEKDLYPYMTVAEIVRFTASFYPHWRAELASRYIRELGAHRKIRSLSRGMRTKLALLLAVCRGAELLLAAEPPSRLAPAERDDALKILVQAGSTVFFSTHDLSEVEQIADRVAIIDRGRIAISAPLDDLRETYRRSGARASRPQRSGVPPGRWFRRRARRPTTADETSALHLPSAK